MHFNLSNLSLIFQLQASRDLHLQTFLQLEIPNILWVVRPPHNLTARENPEHSGGVPLESILTSLSWFPGLKIVQLILKFWIDTESSTYTDNRGIEYDLRAGGEARSFTFSNVTIDLKALHIFSCLYLSTSYWGLS